MADEQQRARPLDELCLEQFEGLQVEVVGWLIKHEQVGRPGEQTREEQAIPLAARECLHRRLRALEGKEEITQVSMNVARPPVDRHHVVTVTDRLEDRSLGIELLALLVVVRHVHVGSEPHLSFVRRQLAE